MLYQSMVIALQKGWRIALVIPRTNIVKELGERLKPIFPKTVMKCLHQNEKDDEDADLLILTPQQLLRYHHEFDLIYLDEADAFPYKGNPFLSQLVKKALKEEGKMVQMSATIPKKQQQAIARKHQPLFVLPARFHRHKLDQFQMSYCLNMSQWPKNQTIIPKILTDWLDKHQKQPRQALLFVPTIAWGVWVFETMKQQGYQVESVSSVDERRDNKISWFRDKLGLFLVTTTLLERGVTFSDIDVAIINGSHAVYDEFTLVQMAGRVGRKPDYPTGEIMIFTERMTKAIQNAEKYIQKMNSEALKRRLLDDDLPNLR
jgi:competence protein ComFA